MNKEQLHKINKEITSLVVRVILEDGTANIVSLKEALEIADNLGLDLVEISPNTNPPVCKVMNYQKYLYNLKKKQKNIKAKTAKVTIKEIRLGPNTDDHDFNFKVKHARNFINEGSKVKAIVIFRGRELAHTQIGKDLLLKFIEAMSDIAKIDQPLNEEGRSVSVILSPIKISKSTVNKQKEKSKKEITREIKSD